MIFERSHFTSGFVQFSRIGDNSIIRSKEMIAVVALKDSIIGLMNYLTARSFTVVLEGMVQSSRGFSFLAFAD